MAADLISVPFKKPSEVDIVTPLKNLINSSYSAESDKKDNYTDAINELSKLRNNAIWRVFEKYESSLEVIYGYYDQLCALEGKIPVHELQVPFKWKDAFDKGSLFGGRISLTLTSLPYEKVCVLFNIAALQSAVAAIQSLDSDDGLKLAAKLLQQAAGIFTHLKGGVVLAIHQEPTPDLGPDVLGALAALMLAQAQEIFVHKAIHDNMKDAIIAKLSCQCEDLYADALRALQKSTAIQGLWEKDWIPTVAGKQAAFHAMAEFYQSLVCRSNKTVGEEIARLQHAVDLFKTAQNSMGSLNFFDEFNNRAQTNLNEARKDNDFIYHERIPQVNALAPIGKANVAKPLPIPERMSASFKDLFQDLVPVSVHQAMAAYEMRKNEIVNAEISKLRESTQTLNSVLASLNLPAAIEKTSGSQLPQSLLEKAETLRSMGGANSIKTLIQELPELLQRNRDILDESERMLKEESDSDEALRQQFKERWSRTPSAKLTEMFKSNADKYRQIINNATQADGTVKQKFDAHFQGMELLSKSNEELQRAIPSDGACISDCSSVNRLRDLMEVVETIKAERDVIESELKSATLDMRSQFLQALAQDGAINEPAMSSKQLGAVLGPLQTQVKESAAKQVQLIKDIQEAHQKFCDETGGGAGSRDAKMKQLASAFDAFMELQNNLKEGTKFYNDLTQLLVVFQNKISEFCFARKTEKEELLKDLTQESSRQAPGSTPTMPSHYSNIPAEAKREAPARPPPPNVGNTIGTTGSTMPDGSVPPYPMAAQGMPVPYGASTSAPYPTYVPPPMPQGYNPYATLPYPQGYNYPGFPQAPPQGYMGYVPQPYQQQPPGQNPQQPQPRPGW